ncbi:hypothetical protein C8J55DRAFT_494522 [Lentinula edodes]|uniref:Uncharacterized protein n=1 Tax=Lentinula lateritia TaxID=40482 RepID=A0A9W8ZQV1_9AGAR|nr:hypothetical protein C8J55DRAFT_494522 [Lentinula edodes]
MNNDNDNSSCNNPACHADGKCTGFNSEDANVRPKSMQICDYCGLFLKQHNQKSSEAKPPPPSTSTLKFSIEFRKKYFRGQFCLNAPVPQPSDRQLFDRLAASERLRDRHQDTMNGLGRSKSRTVQELPLSSYSQESKRKSATGDQEEDPLAKSKKLKPTNPLEIWVILVEDTAAVDAGNCKALSPASITRIWNKGGAHRIMLHPDDHPETIRKTIVEVVIEQGTNQATRKFGPRVWIALAAGSGPAFKSDTTPSPNETSQFNVLNEDSEPTWDDWMMRQRIYQTTSHQLLQYFRAITAGPVHLDYDPHLLHPLPPTGTDSDPDIGMHDIFEMTGCKINELWKLCFYITGPSYMAVSWWPSTLEGRFKILNPIINRIEADIRRLRKPNSKHSLLAILDDCHDEGDLLPTLQPLSISGPVTEASSLMMFVLLRSSS